MGYLSAGVIFLVVFSTIVLTYMSLPKRLQIEVMEWIDNA